MRRKLLALLLTAIIAAAMLPAQLAYADDPVCEIEGGGQYGTLDEAIDNVPADTPMTIRLLKNISMSSTLTVSGSKKITLELNGYTLEVNAASGSALETSYGGSLTTAGTGAMNLTGVLYGIDAHHGGSADITGTVVATGDTSTHSNGIGVNAYGSGTSVSVNGNVTGDSSGTSAYTDGQIHVTGDVTASNVAVNAASGGQISVSGDVSAVGVGVGVQADSATVTVGGSVIASGAGGLGILVSHAAVVTVDGDVTAVHQGVSASYQSTLHVRGNVTVTDTVHGNGAVTASTSAMVAVDGNVSASAYGVGAETSGDVTIKGNVFSYYCGVNTGTGAKVLVLGNIVADGTIGVGVNAYSASRATVDGTIQAHKAITFGETDGAEVIPTTRTGYRTYSDGGEYPSYVWVKDTSSTLPTVVTYAVTGMTKTTANIAGAVTTNGSEKATEYGFVYGAAENPEIGGAGVTKELFGTGVTLNNAFGMTITGLASGTTYHVRAYAINDGVTLYGQDRAFTTLTDSSSPVPNPETGDDDGFPMGAGAAGLALLVLGMASWLQRRCKKT